MPQRQPPDRTSPSSRATTRRPRASGTSSTASEVAPGGTTGRVVVDARCDVLVVGGGPAGLSAALLLGRSRRDVVLCDARRPRNAAAAHAHGFLTRDGIRPLELLTLGRHELRPYGVDVRDAVVSALAPTANGITATLEDGTAVFARKVLLATGVVDRLPDIAGFGALYGTSIHHCPYCDGWEHRDRRLAVYGRPDDAAGLALSLLTWSSDVIVCTNGRPLTAKARRRLDAAGIATRLERIDRLEGRDGRLSRIVFARGEAIQRDALFFNTGQWQRSALAAQLGCGFTRTGHVRCDRKGRTGVPNLFIAGDANGDVQFVIVAAAEGAAAAVAINTELQEDDHRAAGRAGCLA